MEASSVHSHPYVNTPIPTPTPTFSERDIYYRWRLESAIVACIDFGLNGLTILILVPFAIIFGSLQVATNYLDYEYWKKWSEEVEQQANQLDVDDNHKWMTSLTGDPSTWSTFKIYVLLGIIFGLVASVIELWAANKLRIAASVKREPSDCLPRTQTWLNVNVTILLLSCSSLIFAYNRWSIWFFLFLRCVRIGVVYMYLLELKQYVETKIKYSTGSQQTTSA